MIKAIFMYLINKNYLLFICTLIGLCGICVSAIGQNLPVDRNYTLGPQTPENDLIKLRYAMETAVRPSEKKDILKKIAQTGTFQGMMYAAKYMDLSTSRHGNTQLRKTAAMAVAEIAVGHPEYNGAMVRQILRKAQTLVSTKMRKKLQEYITSSNETGFVSMFNGKDLTGWKGLVQNPIKRRQMTTNELVEAQKKADEIMRKDWKVEDGLLTYVGTGYDNICTESQYKDFEMYVDWALDPDGKEPDAGIYLRGTPQVQIWDTARINVGAQVGSGGLYNNKKYESKPSVVADNKVGIWNSFYIKMIDDKVTVFLNGVKVVDAVTMENYWDRNQPIFPVDQIELQAHGSKVYYRDLYIKRLE